MGLVHTFWITTKQRLLTGYAGEILPVTTVRKNFSIMSEINADSGDLQREKMTKSLEKKMGHSFQVLRVLYESGLF